MGSRVRDREHRDAFFFGAAVGGLTVGGYAWTSPFAISTGLLAVALCAQIGAVFLTLETLGPLREDFRVRAIAATFALAVLGAVALGVAAVTSHETFAGLTQPHSLIGVGIAMTLGVLVLGALWFHMYHAARFAVALESIAMLAGWYASQAPYVIPHELTYAQAAAPQATLVDFLWLCAGGSVLLIPSLIFLFSIFKSDVHEPT